MSILTSSQFGFRPGISTADAISSLSEFLYDSLNNRFSTITVFVDFRRAFDTVNIEILLRKLYSYGIRGISHKLFSSYLANRSHFTLVNGASSSVRSSRIGVPQGSVLGPLLFLIYINDLPNVSKVSNTVLFADDTTLSFKNANINELFKICNIEMANFSKWAVANRLSINTEKTFYCVVSNRNLNYNSYPNVLLDGQNIDRVEKLRFLGVIFDDQLKFNHHIDFISKKVSKSTGILNRIKNHVPHSILKLLYSSLIYSHFSYCNLIWGGTFSSHIQRLVLLQKKSIRIINNSNYLAHTNELFIKNSLLKMADINIF